MLLLLPLCLRESHYGRRIFFIENVEGGELVVTDRR
jgi:hypothetical protein